MTPVFSYDVQASINEAEIEQFINFIVDALLDKSVSFEKDHEIVLAFVSPKRSQALNKEFRDKDQSTDVLSFGSADPDCVGELILCPEVIESQAKKNGWTEQHEYSYMILHGLLHLLGYDHEKDDKAAAEMYSLQDDIFFEYFPGAK